MRQGERRWFDKLLEEEPPESLGELAGRFSALNTVSRWIKKAWEIKPPVNGEALSEWLSFTYSMSSYFKAFRESIDLGEKPEGCVWCDLHGHTTLSDGLLGPIGSLLFFLYSKELRNLDAFAYTDHNNLHPKDEDEAFKINGELKMPEVDDAFMIATHFLNSDACERLFRLKPNPKPNSFIIPGTEISGENHAHILAYFDPELYEKKLCGMLRKMGGFPKGAPWADINEMVHWMEGFSAAAHPLASLLGWVDDYRGTGAEFLVREHGFDAVETINASLPNLFNNAGAIMINRSSENPLSEIGGSDDHIPGNKGFGYTEYKGEPNFKGLKQAVLERRTRARGHVYSPLHLISGPLRYYRFYQEVKDIPEFTRLLRDPMEMYSPLLLKGYKAFQRAVQYSLAGKKVKTTSLLFPPKPRDLETGKIIIPKSRFK